MDDQTLVAVRYAVGAGAGPGAPLDRVGPRIGRTIDWIRQRLDAPISLADAAYGAGFSDSVHLSGACRRMFGIASVTPLRE